MNIAILPREIAVISLDEPTNHFSQYPRGGSQYYDARIDSHHLLVTPT